MNPVLALGQLLTPNVLSNRFLESVGDHRATTFEPLWAMVSVWHCFFYVTDGLVDMLKHSIRLLIHYLKFWEVPVPPRVVPAF
jgi:hypothetical protein